MRLFLSVLLAALLSTTLPAQEPKKLRIVTSFTPLTAHAKALVDDRAMVEQLVDRETGPHDYELKPSDVKKIAEADLLIVNGLGLEGWLAELVKKTAKTKVRVIDTSSGIPTVAAPAAIEVLPHDHSAHGHHHHHDHGDRNPHIWLDPLLAKKQAETILAALLQADPDGKPVYEKNARAYFAELDKLHAEFTRVLGSVKERDLVTFHDAFPYLAKRYNLNYVGFIEEYPEKDPTPKQLALLVDAIRSRKIKVLFAETGYSPKLMETIARQTGARTALLDTLEVGVGDAGSYLERMRKNLDALRQAWQ
jgi:ABC-type Zn uptake system ZnuABC Zn-binding protein ZnuA